MLLRIRNVRHAIADSKQLGRQKPLLEQKDKNEMEEEVQDGRRLSGNRCTIYNPGGLKFFIFKFSKAILDKMKETINENALSEFGLMP